jgi:hypothetical protein
MSEDRAVKFLNSLKLMLVWKTWEQTKDLDKVFDKISELGENEREKMELAMAFGASVTVQELREFINWDLVASCYLGSLLSSYLRKRGD